MRIQAASYDERQDLAMPERSSAFGQQETSARSERISSGVAHRRFEKGTYIRPKSLAVWEDLALPARNEWICWIESAKKPETRSRALSGVVQVLRVEDDAPVVGRDAPAANSKVVKLDTATAHRNRQSPVSASIGSNPDSMLNELPDLPGN